MKGQMYIILAILTVTAIVLLRISLNLSSILENNRNLQSNLDTLELQNIEKGIRQSLISSYSVANRNDNIDYFIDFVKSSEASRGNTLSGLDVQSSYPNVTGGSVSMNTTVHNFLGAQISNFTMVWSYDGSTRSFIVTDNATNSTTLSFSGSQNANYTLTVNYTVSGVTTTKNITIPVEIGKSRFVGFYTMTLSTGQSSPVDEFTNAAVLNQTQYT